MYESHSLYFDYDQFNINNLNSLYDDVNVKNSGTQFFSYNEHSSIYGSPKISSKVRETWSPTSSGSIASPRVTARISKVDRNKEIIPTEKWYKFLLEDISFGQEFTDYSEDVFIKINKKYIDLDMYKLWDKNFFRSRGFFSVFRPIRITRLAYVTTSACNIKMWPYLTVAVTPPTRLYMRGRPQPRHLIINPKLNLSPADVSSFHSQNICPIEPGTVRLNSKDDRLKSTKLEPVLVPLRLLLPSVDVNYLCFQSIHSTVPCAESFNSSDESFTEETIEVPLTINPKSVLSSVNVNSFRSQSVHSTLPCAERLNSKDDEIKSTKEKPTLVPVKTSPKLVHSSVNGDSFQSQSICSSVPCTASLNSKEDKLKPTKEERLKSIFSDIKTPLPPYSVEQSRHISLNQNISSDSYELLTTSNSYKSHVASSISNTSTPTSESANRLRQFYQEWNITQPCNMLQGLNPVYETSGSKASPKPIQKQLGKHLIRPKPTKFEDFIPGNGFHVASPRGRPIQKRTEKQYEYCKFCYKNGELSDIYMSHITKNSDGTIVCPILRKYVCDICGATGDRAHTRRYCKLNTQQNRATPVFRRLANGVLTSCHNHK